MAKVVRSEIIVCPGCQARATVQIFSCGCQRVLTAKDLIKRGAAHQKGCQQSRLYFEGHNRRCGQAGPTSRHHTTL